MGLGGRRGLVFTAQPERLLVLMLMLVSPRHHRAVCILHPVTVWTWLETKRPYLGRGDCDGKERHEALPDQSLP